MSSQGEAPVIRVIKKKGHGGHHGGAWKVAYADFVTAMMAFFLVMWILGLSKPTRVAIAAYFNNPQGFMKTARGGVSPLAEGEGVVAHQGKPTPIISGEGGAKTASLLAAQFKEVSDAIMKKLQKTPEFKSLEDSIQVHLTDEGLRIELEEKTSSLFFDSGSASLKPRTVRLLQLIAKELRHLNNPIVIEGHTDGRPFEGPNHYTNWELSADRANSARRAMETNGLRKGQVLGVRGYADHKLLDPEHPLNFMNRRVSILVAYSTKGE